MSGWSSARFSCTRTTPVQRRLVSRACRLASHAHDTTAVETPCTKPTNYSSSRPEASSRTIYYYCLSLSFLRFRLDRVLFTVKHDGPRKKQYGPRVSSDRSDGDDDGNRSCYFVPRRQIRLRAKRVQDLDRCLCSACTLCVCDCL